jgi:iduronate 2-sulfatase
VDLYPTIADFCDVKAPAGLAGQSLRPLLVNPGKPGKEAAYTIVTRGRGQRGESVRTDRWRFTLWSDGSKELYDHESDPEETLNLAGASRFEKVVSELTAKLKAK